MDTIIPYLFFIYTFIVSWICIMNYDTILKMSTSKRTALCSMSLFISIVVFVGVSTIYHFETNEDDFKSKISNFMTTAHIF